jgi:hypothetical protein
MPIERQKVSLINAAFNDKTVAALQLSGADETFKFVQMLTTLWKILNVKHPFAHIRLNDTHRQPIKSCEDDNLQYMEKMLNLFHDMPGGRGLTRKATLTTETRKTLIQTLSGLIYLSKRLLDNGWDFIMLGSFQTDNLEGEFGVYRQKAGGCYYISVDQVLCTARFREMELFMNCDAMENLPHTKSLCYKEPLTDQEWEVIDDCVSHIPTISDHELGSLFFVAGYIAMKERIENTEPNMEHGEFLDLVSRGKLHQPPAWLFHFAQATYAAFKDLTNKKCRIHLTNIFNEIFHAHFIENLHSSDPTRLCNCYMKGEVRRYEDSFRAPAEISSRKLRKLDNK